MLFDVNEKVEETADYVNAIKHAPVPEAVIDAIKKRWSIRAFSDEMIPDETMHILFEAAGWAPSSMNEQPWRFMYADRGSESFNKIAGTLSPSNKSWAEKAPIMIAVFAEKNFRMNGRPNPYALHDTGAAVYGMLLQAQAMDIYGHIMGGFDKQGLKNALRISPELEPVTVLAIGFQGAPDELNEELRRREFQPRKRKPVEDFAVKLG